MDSRQEHHITVLGAEAWLALVLGAGLIPFSGELACYYYAFLLVFGLAWGPLPWVAVMLGGLSAVTNIAPAVWTHGDDQFTAISAAMVAFVVASTVLAWRSLGRTPTTVVPAQPESTGGAPDVG